MAFFGITTQGPQNPFTAINIESMRITLFEEEEMRDAFTRAAGDDGTLSVDEVPVMLRILYHGDAPRRETERIMAAVDEATDEGRRIDWPGFQALIAELYAGADAAEAEDDGKAVNDMWSLTDLRALRRRHMLSGEDERATSLVAGSTGHEVGWLASKEECERNLETLRPKKKSAETRFAEKLLASGGFL